MGLDHDAIRKAYPSVAFIDDTNSVIKDSSGNDIIERILEGRIQITPSVTKWGNSVC